VGQQKYKKVTGYVEKKIGNELVIVPIAKEVAQMNIVFSLNEVGLFIYEQLYEPKSEAEITNLVCNEFEVKNNVAYNDIKYFLKEAIDAKIIKEIESKK